MKFLQILMNPHAFVGASKVKVASVNAFHLFLNDEAVFHINSKFPYADLKRMWEGGQYFNVKHDALNANYVFRMPFVYITNQTTQNMKTNISASLEDDDQVIDSFYNRIIQVDLNRPNNQYFLKRIEPDISVLDLHALFWCILIHEFRILELGNQTVPTKLEPPKSKYLALINQPVQSVQQSPTQATSEVHDQLQCNESVADWNVSQFGDPELDRIFDELD